MVYPILYIKVLLLDQLIAIEKGIKHFQNIDVNNLYGY